ncbi:Crp/Fnr family transcriptional regulator [Aquimarina sp. 2201CG5-10]|uniref:Crp/Fnr family transcriptional regulator n=1 Tax=Aquimarina callyspongiae TaxID=3098150 RepID=UPI002AB5C480|nr:Crp/Fnr family transcriptional regulator [Aquimarina sp. 2201CG5-10]MDY8138199.1 Crp/Fnr family transcriptional regulator [Aquimarina sp. 2201CG5-10]
MHAEKIELSNCFPFIEPQLKEEIVSFGEFKSVPKGEYVVKQGSYLNFLPIILDGLIKMYAEEDEVEFLLYYIHPNHCCILSFNHLFNQEAVRFSAVTEKDTKVLCLPVDKVKEWFIKYPSFTRIILQDFQRNYEDLLNTTKQVVCYKIEDRLVNYLTKKAKLQNCNMIQMSHKQIASDLGTSREVVSRITKKLEASSVLVQHKRHIELLSNNVA